MLIDTQYLSNTKKLVISYVNKEGDIKLKYYNWENPVKYVSCDDNDPQKHPDYKSWDGKSVKLVEVSGYPDRYAIYEFLDSLPKAEQDEIFEFNIPKIYFIDIETEIVDGFPEASDVYKTDRATGQDVLVKEGASTQVLSISIVYDNKIILLGLKDMDADMQERITKNTNNYFKKFGIDYKFKYIKYEDEFDMLYSFFNKMVDKMPVLTGWNFLNYDWAFLVNRARKLKKMVNGREYTIDPRNSSLTKKMSKIWGTTFEVPQHRMIFDYMQLYEIADTSIKVKESSSLDFVSSKLVGIDKIKYVNSIFKLKSDRDIEGYELKTGDICRKEGDIYYMYDGQTRIDMSPSTFNKYKDSFKEVNVSNLQTLYEEDFEIYMYYNAVDSVLVQKIHEARNYISIIFAISSLSKIKVVDVVSQMNNALASLAITEGVLRNRFRENENIVLFKEGKNEMESTITGGWVKEPIVGLNQWCVTYDFASLYPTTQRQFYISPENFVGIKDSKNPEVCTNGRVIDRENHVVCVNGSVFEKRMSTTLKMLEDVYADRKKNKKIMMEKKEELREVTDEIKRLEEELFGSK
jgi:DNA polymerase elongation subunit (family B)